MKSDQNFWKKVFLAIFLYTSINILAITVQYIPGMITLFFWGIVAPLLAIIFLWIYLKTKKMTQKKWIVTSLLGSVYFIFTGFCSFFIIVSLWAGV